MLENKKILYLRAYDFEFRYDDSRSFGLFNFLSYRFPHDVCDLQNARSRNWINIQFPIHGQTKGRNQQIYM